MTVSDLIEKLSQLPQDYAIVVNHREVSSIDVYQSFYVLDENSKDGYVMEPSVVLE